MIVVMAVIVMRMTGMVVVPMIVMGMAGMVVVFVAVIVMLLRMLFLVSVSVVVMIMTALERFQSRYRAQGNHLDVVGNPTPELVGPSVQPRADPQEQAGALQLDHVARHGLERVRARARRHQHIHLDALASQLLGDIADGKDAGDHAHRSLARERRVRTDPKARNDRKERTCKSVHRQTPKKDWILSSYSQ